MMRFILHCNPFFVVIIEFIKVFLKQKRAIIIILC